MAKIAIKHVYRLREDVKKMHATLQASNGFANEEAKEDFFKRLAKKNSELSAYEEMAKPQSKRG